VKSGRLEIARKREKEGALKKKETRDMRSIVGAGARWGRGERDLSGFESVRTKGRKQMPFFEGNRG